MADLIPMLAAVAGQAGEEADDNFNQTVLLLHGDGTNGAQNNTFLDGSTNNFTITRNGNTTQGTFSPFSAEAGKWATYFPTNSTSSGAQRLQSSISTAFGAGNFTVEFWIYLIGVNSSSTILDMRTDSGTALTIGVNSSGDLNVVGSTTFIASSSSTDIPRNTWTHVAVVRSGTGTDEVTVYINGVAAATGTCADNFTTTSVTLANRYTSSPPNTTHCYLSNFRISNTARSISVPGSPYTSDANTLLLLCQSNCHIDNGPDARTVTTPDGVKPTITPFSPFAPSAAYSASTNGGSGYFDGTGDYLSIADNAALELGSSDFTIEAWVYLNAGSAFQSIVQKRSSGAVYGGYGLYINSSDILEFVADNDTSFTWAVDITTGPELTLRSWNHVAVTRSGSTWTTWVNGAQSATATASITINDQATSLGIGAIANGDQPINGYLSNVRIVKGTAVYTAAFTPPTAPLTAISNTSLLCNFTNAGIFDNTGKNNLETVGNAQIDTTTKKYGTGSMEFDGTGDWLLMPNTPDQQLGTGNFTIEFWVYLATGDIGSARGLVAKGTSTTGLLVSLDSSEKVVFTYTTSTITSSGAINTNAWNHIAVVREGTGSNQTKIYINGTNDGTGTVSTNFNQTNVMYVGANRTGGDPMKGFIDDLRITKGVARYTAGFTAPTKAFPDQ